MCFYAMPSNNYFFHHYLIFELILNNCFDRKILKACLSFFSIKISPNFVEISLFFSCPDMNIFPLNYEKYRKKSIGYPLWILFNFEQYFKSSNQIRVFHFLKFCHFWHFFLQEYGRFLCWIMIFFYKKIESFSIFKFNFIFAG